MQYIPCVVHLIGTGTERNNSITRPHINSTLKGRTSLCISNIRRKCFIILKLHIETGQCFLTDWNNDTGEKLYQIIPMRGIEGHGWVLIIIFLLLVILNCAKHRPVTHVMPIDDGILILKVGRVTVVHKYCPATAIYPVKTVFQIILIIPPLNNRIVYNGITNRKPSHCINVLLKQIGKIHP